MGQTLIKSAWWQEKQQQTLFGTYEILLIYILGERIRHGYDQTLVQIVLRGCKTSILTGNKNLTGEDPEQPALSSRLDQMTPKSHFQCKLFYDNLILRGKE